MLCPVYERVKTAPTDLLKRSNRPSDAQPARLGFIQNRDKHHCGGRKTEKKEQKGKSAFG